MLLPRVLNLDDDLPSYLCQGGATHDHFNPTGMSSKFVKSHLLDHVEYCDLPGKDQMIAGASV